MTTEKKRLFNNIRFKCQITIKDYLYLCFIEYVGAGVENKF